VKDEPHRLQKPRIAAGLVQWADLIFQIPLDSTSAGCCSRCHYAQLTANRRRAFALCDQTHRARSSTTRRNLPSSRKRCQSGPRSQLIQITTLGVIRQHYWALHRSAAYVSPGIGIQQISDRSGRRCISSRRGRAWTRLNKSILRVG